MNNLLSSSKILNEKLFVEIELLSCQEGNVMLDPIIFLKFLFCVCGTEEGKSHIKIIGNT